MSSGSFSSSGLGNPAVSAVGTDGADGLDASTDYGTAISGNANTGYGVSGSSITVAGVYAESGSGDAVFAATQSGNGVDARSGTGIGVHAVGGGATAANPPPVAQAAVFAEGGPASAIYATSDAVAIYATTTNETGIVGTSASGIGVNGVTTLGYGVQGTAEGNDDGFGVGVSAQAINPASIALQVIGRVQIQGGSVGSVTLAHGTKTVPVSSAAATPDSLIFLTPLEDPRGSLWIGARSAGGFTIKASTAPSADVTIGFLIIN
jgi:hypothetical protein